MSSKPPRRARRLSILLGALCLFAAKAAAGQGRAIRAETAFSPAGQVLLNRDEALALAFGEAEVARSTVYLDEQEQKKIADLCKGEFESSVVYPYRATRKGKWIGTAYFDTHRVRALRETLMVVVKADGTLGRVEVLSFAEPREYLPRSAWYEQFRERKLDEDLNLGHKIRGVTGATLTAQATTRCARRVLALHTHLEQLAAAKRREEAARKKREEERGGDGSGPPGRP
jgi:hypothetical protein